MRHVSLQKHKSLNDAQNSNRLVQRQPNLGWWNQCFARRCGQSWDLCVIGTLRNIASQMHKKMIEQKKGQAIPLVVPRIFVVNQRSVRPKPARRFDHCGWIAGFHFRSKLSSCDKDWARHCFKFWVASFCYSFWRYDLPTAGRSPAGPKLLAAPPVRLKTLAEGTGPTTTLSRALARPRRPGPGGCHL